MEEAAADFNEEFGLEQQGEWPDVLGPYVYPL